MSTQRGNTARQRPQKHKNITAFKNSLHDKTPKTQLINNIEVAGVCRKCVNILEWKIKYKKYKLLKAPRKCTKCEQKCIKSAYHIMCLPCSKSLNVCPKCGKNEEIVKESVNKEEQFKLDQEMQQMVKSLSERKRRTFLRYMSKQSKADKSEDSEPKNLKDVLLVKLESLKVEDDKSDDLFDDSDDYDSLSEEDTDDED